MFFVWDEQLQGVETLIYNAIQKITIFFIKRVTHQKDIQDYYITFIAKLELKYIKLSFTVTLFLYLFVNITERKFLFVN